MECDATTAELEAAIVPVQDTVNAACAFFAIIIVGYAIRASHAVSAEASSQVGKVAVSVALPAAMFLPMATLDLAGLRWGVVTSVAAAKAGTWLLGALGGYLMGTTPGNRVAMAGIVSMFATCSNDTVFGLPIFEAVLPGNVADIYSVAPVQLLVFNPLSMAVIALGDDARDASGRKLSAAAKLRGVAASVLNNPIVLSTALGLCFNLAGMHLPVFAETAVRRLGAALPATAFLSLGMAFSGKIGAAFRPSMLLRTAPLLVLKLGVATALTVAAQLHFTNGTQLAFASIYGAIPTAPSPYLIAVATGASPEVVGAATVQGMLLCVPLLVGFIAAADGEGRAACALSRQADNALRASVRGRSAQEGLVVVMSVLFAVGLVAMLALHETVPLAPDAKLVAPGEEAKSKTKARPQAKKEQEAEEEEEEEGEEENEEEEEEEEGDEVSPLGHGGPSAAQTPPRTRQSSRLQRLQQQLRVDMEGAPETVVDANHVADEDGPRTRSRKGTRARRRAVPASGDDVSEKAPRKRSPARQQSSSGRRAATVAEAPVTRRRSRRASQAPRRMSPGAL